MKLTIHNIEKLIGRFASSKWEIQHIETLDTEYIFELVNAGHYKSMNWWFAIDRIQWGDGYRLWMKDVNMKEQDLYFRIENIKHPNGLLVLTAQLIKQSEQ